VSSHGPASPSSLPCLLPHRSVPQKPTFRPNRLQGSRIPLLMFALLFWENCQCGTAARCDATTVGNLDGHCISFWLKLLHTSAAQGPPISGRQFVMSHCAGHAHSRHPSAAYYLQRVDIANSPGQGLHKADHGAPEVKERGTLTTWRATSYNCHHTGAARAKASANKWTVRTVAI